jgi:6-phosphogluconolactonase (cycloisomerase 2 family)
LLLALGAAACSSAAHSTHLAYVTTSGGINAYRIDSISGSASSIFTAPFIVGNSPFGIVVPPSKQFAFVANQSDNTISILKIDSISGALKEMLPRTNVAAQSPGPMIMDPGGNFLFVANQGSNDVSVFSVSSSGALSPVTQPSGALTVSVGSIPTAMAVTNSGNLLFVAVPNFSSIYAFAVNAGALTPAPGSPFSVPNGVSSVAASPTGNFVYVPNAAANTISGFSIQASSPQLLQPLSGSPFPDICGGSTTGCTSPSGALVDPTGKYLYVANYSSTNISQYTIDSSTGALTTITKTTPTAGTNPAFLVLDPDGKLVYVINVGSKSATELKLNSDGSLSSTSNSIQVGAVPRALALTR